MKKQFSKILSRPAIIIPMFAIIGLIVLFIEYNNIGKAPILNIVNDVNNTEVISSKNVDLSFPKNGRIESVSVKNGDTVHKGEILAKLSSPDAEGLVSQAKGSLNLAEAQYASLNSQYATTKKQQDLIVENSYQILLSNGLEGIPDKQNKNQAIISGTYTCGKEGNYEIKPYASGDSDSGFSFNYDGLESGTSSVKYDNPVPLGNCGLQIKFTNSTYFDQNIIWIINIPNVKSPSYLANSNAYKLALENRDKILSDLSTTLGNNSSDTSVAKAQVEAAKGAYEAAVGSYQNNLIISPVDGTINFIDKNLVVGQSTTLNKTVISITTK